MRHCRSRRKHREKEEVCQVVLCIKLLTKVLYHGDMCNE